MAFGDIRMNLILGGDGICRCHSLMSPIHSSGGDFDKVIPFTNPDGTLDVTGCIYQRIYFWMATRKGERPLFPRLGCCILDYLNEPMTVATLKAMKADVQYELKKVFPEYSIDNLRIIPSARNEIKISCYIGGSLIQFMGNATEITMLQDELSAALSDLKMAFNAAK